jgi:hypothetical protein
MSTDGFDKRIRLENQHAVAAILEELERRVVRPIIRHFNLATCSLTEHSPDERKAGITIRKRMTDAKSNIESFTYSIRVRIRSREDPVRKMLSHGTHIAVTLHELAHLKFLNHGPDFALFLRDIYVYARARLGLFQQPLHNQIPSPWEWERAIWDTKGDIDDVRLLQLHASWWKTQ